MISQNISINNPNLIIIDVSSYENSEATALAQLIKKKLSARTVYLVPSADSSILSKAKLVLDDPVNNIIDLGNNYFFNSDKSQLYYDKEMLVLTKKESTFLELLIRNKGSIITFKELVDYIWGENKAAVYSIKSLVHRLRKKLEIDIIKTAHTVGYYIK